jgi:hypothetical protein
MAGELPERRVAVGGQHVELATAALGVRQVNPPVIAEGDAKR